MITIPLDNTDLKPFYIQIYEYIRKEILNGNIAAEEKLPSARNLAAKLNVSRSTVDTLSLINNSEPKIRRGI